MMASLFKNQSGILGAVLLMIPNWIVYCWGNISTYLFSYVIAVTGTDMDIQVHWTFTVLVMVDISILMVSGRMYSTFGKRWTAFCGTLCFSAGYIVSYFAIGISLKAAIVSLGVFFGAGIGIMEGVTMKYIFEVSQKDSGSKISLIQAAPAAGALVINQLITLYLNPTNLSPDVKVGNTSFFSQEGILSNVPRMMLLLAGLSFGIHVTGIVLLKKPKESSDHFEISTHEYDAVQNSEVIEEDSIQPEVDCDGQERDTGDETNNKYSERSVSKNDNEITPESISKEVDEKGNCIGQLSVIRSRSFIALWISYFCVDTSNILLGNFYKVFGQEWIHDDYFFSFLVTVMSFVTVVSRLTGGVFLDKVGHKIVMITIFTGASLLPLLLYFSAALDKWLYFFLTLLLWMFTSVTVQTWIMATANLFGKENLNTNVGLVFTSAMAIYALSAPVIQACLDFGGWYHVFVFISVMNAIGLVTVILFLK